MKKIVEPYLQSASNVFSQNKLLKICMVLIVLQGFYDSSQIGKIKNTTQTIVIPYGKPNPYVLKAKEVNDIYLYDMASYIIHLSGNLNASNADIRMGILLSLFHPTTYAKYQTHLKKISKEIEKYKSISHYSELDFPNPIYIKENVMTIKYKRSRITGDTLKAPEHREMKITFKIENSQFYILEMEDK